MEITTFSYHYLRRVYSTAMEVIDFYKGFEGEPEIKISQQDISGKIILTIKVWGGYFDRILLKIKPNQSGSWEGIPLYYHLHTGFYDQSPWKCDNNELILWGEQLKEISDFNFDNETMKVYRGICDIVEDCLKKGDSLYFEYE